MGVLDFVNTGLQAGAQILNQINQGKQWKREDTAVQRRVADLKAAGLSPVLAAGSAASSSAPIRVEAPQFTSNVEAQNAGIGRTKADIERTKADTDYVRANYLNALNELPVKQYQAFQSANEHQYLEDNPEVAREYAKSAVNRKMDENKEVSRNLGIYRDYNVPSIGTAGDDVISAMQFVKNLVPGLDTGKASGMSVLGRILAGTARVFMPKRR